MTASTLAGVMTFAGLPERVSDPASEDFVTIRLNGRGAVKRGIAAGKTPAQFTGYRVRAGQFVYSRIDARNGAFAIIPSELDGAVVSKDFPVFDIHDDRVDRRYLMHFFKAGQLHHQIRSMSFGATNRQRIREDMFLSLQIPLGSLDEQRRIAAILDQADALRSKRRRVLAHLDDLAQAIFVDMFGDPIINSMSWSRLPLSELVTTIDSGKSPICESRPADAGEWGVLKLGAVSSGTFIAQENKAYLGDVSALRVHEVRPGDVLFARKNTRELVGSTARVIDVRRGLLIPDLIFRLQLRREQVEPSYLQTLLMHRRKRDQVQDLSSGSASSMPNISKARLRGLPIELPPMESQLRFSERVGRVEAARGLAVRATDYEDELFASLQARAFSGRL